MRKEGAKRFEDALGRSLAKFLIARLARFAWFVLVIARVPEHPAASFTLRV